MVHVMHVLFVFMEVLEKLKALFSRDSMPEHALDVFIENATKI